MVRLTSKKISLFSSLICFTSAMCFFSQCIAHTPQEKITQQSSHILSKRFPIVCCSFQPTAYERILITKLRNKNSSIMTFRNSSREIGEILVSKVVECFERQPVELETPVTRCMGEIVKKPIELVSIMRSGDALLETFISHFPEASVNKILIQRNEESAKPVFSYMKITPSINSEANVIILDPMVATGGTLKMVISLLKEKNVREENITVACIVAAPEGITELCNNYPKIKFVMNVLDEKLNDKKYIVPGLGDFGDRYFGTWKQQKDTP